MQGRIIHTKQNIKYPLVGVDTARFIAKSDNILVIPQFRKSSKFLITSLSRMIFIRAV